MKAEHNPIRGRGSSDNPQNRFEGFYTDYELDEETGEKPAPETKYIRDDARDIIATNNSPDIPFEASLNPYRGCEHGCIYCYARPTHEFLGFSAGLDFESRIMVKYDAVEKLREKFSSRRWQPKVVVMSGVTDPYQPAERKLEITRSCIEVFSQCLNPLSVITKNYLVTRDIDLLKKLAERDAVHVTISVTTLDRELARVMEPRTTQPFRRLEAIEELAKAGISVGVNIAPLIPGLTDHECVDILESAKDAGASHANYMMLRLPYGVKGLFLKWLEQYFPDRKDKVINRIKDMRDGKLNNPNFGERFRPEGEFALRIKELFEIHCKRLGLNKEPVNLSCENFSRLDGNQLTLFG